MAENRIGRNFNNGECVKYGILPTDLSEKESEDFDMTKIRDYNMNGTIILGVDAGYGNYKMARCCFRIHLSSTLGKKARKSQLVTFLTLIRTMYLSMSSGTFKMSN